MEKLDLVQGKTVWICGPAEDKTTYGADLICRVNYHTKDRTDIWATRDARLPVVEKFASELNPRLVVWLCPPKNCTAHKDWYVWRPPPIMLSGIAMLHLFLGSDCKHIYISGWDFYGLAQNDPGATAMHAQAHDICYCAGYLKGALLSDRVTASELVHSALKRF